MEAIPFWTHPLEPMTADAVELFCDADQRARLGGEASDTLLVKLQPSV